MSSEIVTSDLSYFGNREINMLKSLLDAYLKDCHVIEDDGLTINFNTHSGKVFLSDESYNTYMLNSGKLEKWLFCDECDREDFISNLNQCDEDWEGVCCECMEGDN